MAKEKAELVRDLDDFQGTAKLWRITGGKRARHVITSAASNMITGPETYVFASNKKGVVTGWSELRGSFRGGLDHMKAINGHLRG